MSNANILRDQSAVGNATTADLVATYNALTGKSIKKFETRSIAESRVRMAIMSAQDAAGHAGVPKDTKPVAETVAELAARAPNPYPPETLSAKLHEEVEARKPVVPRPKKADAPAESTSTRTVITAVRATFAGTSKVQADSNRAAVLAEVQRCAPEPVTVAALDAKLGYPTRGYLQKLLEKAHIALVVA